ncbi:Chloroperoxidase [Mycena amicta]|nr:Chloroperoxidase [Mycena amicta]
MLFQGIGKLFLNIRIFVWDAWLTLLNLVLPSLPRPARTEGESRWPAYVPPGEGDSRCACPALNAMANHGILPHDGRNIKFTDMTLRCHETYNFAMTFSSFTVHSGSDMLKRDYNKDTLDLAELDKHNEIEHDSSLLRQDTYFESDQSKPHIPFINELLSLASGKDSTGKPVLTAADLSKFSSKRRSDSRTRNPEFMLDKTHKIFGSANTSTLLAIFGGQVDDLEVFLKEERLPDNWESKNRSRKGVTFFAFNRTTAKVERGIDEEKYRKEEEEKEKDAKAEAV